MIKKNGNLFATAYLLILFVVYPFFMKNGYVEIGEAKFEFWSRISVSAALFMIFFFVVQVYRDKTIYTMDVWVFLFALCTLISFLISVDRKEAFAGTAGWHMGAFVYGMLCLLYFFISRLWVPGKFVFMSSLFAAGVAFILGILDRFSLYLIPLKIRDPGFISTLGNINWFCGYLVIFLSLGAALFVFADKAEIFFGIFSLIGFMAAFCQGSSSVFLFFGALFVTTFWIAIERREWILKWCILMGSWCLAAQTIRLMRFFLSGYNYETNNLCGFFTNNNITIYLLLADIVLFFIFSRVYNREVKHVKAIRIVLTVCLLLVLVLYGIQAYYHTFINRGNLQSGHYLVWEAAWGNGRGATLRAGISLFQSMSWKNRFFGIGPDCFSVYAYSIPEVSQMLQEYFGGNRLTNAHNELLTMLVNLGIVGTMTYYGIYISYLHSIMKNGRNPYGLSIGVAVVCYVIHNMVSFANILNLPFLIVLLAMGQKCCIISYYDQGK